MAAQPGAPYSDARLPGMGSLVVFANGGVAARHKAKHAWQVVPVEGTDGVASIDPVATNGRAGNGKKAAFNAAPKEASPLPALSSATNARIASFLERVQALNDANATKASVALAVV